MSVVSLPPLKTLLSRREFSTVAGVGATLYPGSGNPSMGLGLELDAIAVVVIGGTLLADGRGHVLGTLLDVLIFGTIQAASCSRGGSVRGGCGLCWAAYCWA